MAPTLQKTYQMPQILTHQGVCYTAKGLSTLWWTRGASHYIGLTKSFGLMYFILLYLWHYKPHKGLKHNKSRGGNRRMGLRCLQLQHHKLTNKCNSIDAQLKQLRAWLMRNCKAKTLHTHTRSKCVTLEWGTMPQLRRLTCVWRERAQLHIVAIPILIDLWCILHPNVLTAREWSPRVVLHKALCMPLCT